MSTAESMSSYDTAPSFQLLLDPSRHAAEPRVDLAQLRDLCVHGIPDHPPHLRPLVYSLLLGVLPLDKRQWKHAIKNQKTHYHGLVKTHMEALASLPTPELPLSSQDKLLLRISRDTVSARSRFPLLKYPLTRSKSSPLAPSVKTKSNASDVKFLDESDSATTSSSEDLSEPEEIARTRGLPSRHHGGQNKELRCRRAAFDRISEIFATQSRIPANQKPASFEERSTTNSEAATTTLSPEIILSIDESIPTSTLSAPEDKASYDHPQQTPSLSLSTPVNEEGKSGSSSRITLLSSKPIPAPGSATSTTVVPEPDTHAEAVCRILIIFVLCNPQWSYHQNLVYIVSLLYTIYLQVEWTTRTRRGHRYRFPMVRNKYAEEETYWAFCGMVREFESVLIGSSSTTPKELTMVRALDCLGRRLKWADEPLWSVLEGNDLSPSSPLYASDWMTHLLVCSISGPDLPPLWDFILSSRLSPTLFTDPLDALIDVCAAILVVCRSQLLRPGATSEAPRHATTTRSTLWGDVERPEAMSTTFDAAQQLNTLRSIPLDKVGGWEAVLHIANHLREARLTNVAGLSLSGEGNQASSGTSNWPILRLVQPIKDSNESQSSLADWSRWTATAYDTVADVSHKLISLASEGSGNKATAHEGRGMWASMRSWASRSESKPPGPLVPYDSSPAESLGGQKSLHDKDQNDVAHPTLPERLAGIGNPFHSPETPPTKRVSLQGPRPLLLSSSARRFSNSGVDRSSRRDSSSSAPGLPSPPSRTLSPPPKSEGVTSTSSLYRIGSQQMTLKSL